jgi:hypothetical protein
MGVSRFNNLQGAVGRPRMRPGFPSAPSEAVPQSLFMMSGHADYLKNMPKRARQNVASDAKARYLSFRASTACRS